MACQRLPKEGDAAWQMAVHLLHRMATAEVLANVITFTAAAKACELGGRYELGLELLSRMSALLDIL
ncbi:unnamed protein product [Symbiodinium sp. CCMP2592]|nr:unnamed protein product [Symbiodinium sp. CCMP2592]